MVLLHTYQSVTSQSHFALDRTALFPSPTRSIFSNYVWVSVPCNRITRTRTILRAMWIDSQLSILETARRNRLQLRVQPAEVRHVDKFPSSHRSWQIGGGEAS